MRVSKLGAFGLRFDVRQQSLLRNTRRLNWNSPAGRLQCIDRRAVHHAGDVQRRVVDRSTQQNLNDNFLRRAKKYGISSVTELDRQGRFFNSEDSSQLVQKEPFRSDFHLWQLLLDYQTHLYGTTGVQSIYRLLRYQGPLVRLGSENGVASALWKQMLSIAARDTPSFDLLDSMCQKYSIARRRPKFVSEVVNALLEANQINKALLFLDQTRYVGGNRFVTILEIIQTYRPENVENFSRVFKIYTRMLPLRLYDSALEELWQSERKDEALLLHKFLIAQGDVPSVFDNIENLIVYLAETDQDIKPIISQLSNAGVDYGHRARLVFEMTKHKIAIAYKNKKGPLRYTSQMRSRPSRVSDSIAAKAFAAKALPFEFTLNSLKAFGLTEIGPQTIREIGLTAGDLETLAQRIAILQKHEIDTGASAYVRTVRKLCQTGQDALLAKILKTDIHHDVFEDPPLQRRLMHNCATNGDWDKVNLLLTILCCGNVQSAAADTARTALLRPATHTNNRQRSLLNFLLQVNGSYSLCDQSGMRVNISQMIIDMRDQRFKGVTHNRQLQWARLVAGLMQEAVLAGHQFEIHEWRHVIARIGGQGATDQAIGLTFWLIRLQLETGGDWNGLVPIASSNKDLSATHCAHFLMDKRFQQALLHTSLKYSLRENFRKPRESWQNCLEFLRVIENKYGIPVDLKALQRVIIIRCRYLRPKRHVPGFRAGARHEQVEHYPQSPERRKDMDRAAWKECTRIISNLHTLWSVPAEERTADLDIAFTSLFADKRKHRRPWARGKGVHNEEDLD